ncbi:phosphatases II [Dichomitus squalens]|uniref:Phosphatases II n=1 Tax=Dichomitus squalens TaxID=114155 RepID=A0A4Q9MB11_9APHY|nr:phosphatases II [Dichomitus squalens]
MANTLLDSRPISGSSSPRRISRVASEPQPAQASNSHQRPHSISPREDALIAQLGPLASQHHASEYNRLKFGPNGSPLAYIPYSVQMPDHYKEMQAHQTRCAEQKAWWPHETHRKLSVKRASAHLSPCGTDSVASVNISEHTTTIDLREQLSAAISTSIIRPLTHEDRHATVPMPQPHWQTSETHPIVISTIIPSDLVLTISSQLRRPAEPYPVVFEVPSSHQLSRMIPTPFPAVVKADPPTSPQISPPPTATPLITPPSTPISPSQSIAKSIKLSSLFWVHPTVRRAFIGAEELHALPKKRSRPASLIVPSRGSMDTTVLQRLAVARNCSSHSLGERHTRLEETQSREPSALKDVFPPLKQASPASNMDIPPALPIPSNINMRLLGNLYMSSCPGKKVRLDGPVRGRNTVCRDLRSDLSRIKNVGAACIVCCLDDAELQTLGVAWSDYARTADELGIDVLRIPIPEGLAPMAPSDLDSHLSKLIESYTLRGRAILVHCRGGVGRAGVIACCWMLKLGLCGWTVPPHGVGDTSQAAPVSSGDVSCQERSERVSRETMRLVERLISVVRRRRSLKAIETYEQVKFLVDYVEFLREQASSGSSFSADLFANWGAQVE